MTVHVREKPPLRQTIVATTPSGKHYRWAEDEPRAENVFGDLRYSDSMPGGYERMSCSLPRKEGMASADLDRLTTINIYGAGGERDGEYRLEEAPRGSGDRVVISPEAVGWVAALDDDKSAREIYVGRDLSRWGEPSTQRKLNLIAAGVDAASGSFSVTPDPSSGFPSLIFQIDRLSTPPAEFVEAWWHGPGVEITTVYAEFDAMQGLSASAQWDNQIVASDDDVGTTTTLLLDADGVDVAGAYYAGIPADRPYLVARFGFTGTFTGDGPWIGAFKRLAVYGRHGLPAVGLVPQDPGGVLASDVVRHAVQKWAPLLNVGPDSIRPSSYGIGHLAFLDMTTASEIVRQASRFELPYWAVWDEREFVWDPNRTPRKRWRARVGPAQLRQTGQSVQRLWESIVVEYRDMDGSTRTVGPPGSGADTEDSLLKDPDPDNPANRLGMVKRDKLVTGTATPGGAIQVGRIFLEESKLLDTSGSATLVGYVEDDRGVLYPYTRVRSGDVIAFTDAADTSERRIVHSEKVRAERACHIDLDAPPKGLEQLLERLDAELVPLGVG